jgi:hypothetical protein
MSLVFQNIDPSPPSLPGLYVPPAYRECAHKSRAQGAPSSLGVYMYANQGGERDHQRGLREVRSCRFCRA